MKMIWDTRDHRGEVLHLRHRVAELEAQLIDARAEYRAACDTLAEALDDLQRRVERLEGQA